MRISKRDGATTHRAVRRPFAFSYALLLTASSFTAMGCSEGPAMAPVSGRISFRGKPLEFGSVMFQHQSGGQPARSAIASDGTFELSTYEPGDGARVGKNLVRVTSFAGNDPNNKQTLETGEAVLGESLIPQKYASFGSSGLSVEVKPDEPQTFDFELAE